MGKGEKGMGRKYNRTDSTREEKRGVRETAREAYFKPT
jgi:hypothetical protein